jgi:hypothetical protein
MFESKNNGKILCLVLRVEFLTFVGPCIVIYFYSKTNQMHSISNLFYFGRTLYMFRTFAQESKIIHTASGIRHTGAC